MGVTGLFYISRSTLSYLTTIQATGENLLYRWLFIYMDRRDHRFPFVYAACDPTGSPWIMAAVISDISKNICASPRQRVSPCTRSAPHTFLMLALPHDGDHPLRARSAPILLTLALPHDGDDPLRARSAPILLTLALPHDGDDPLCTRSAPILIVFMFDWLS